MIWTASLHFRLWSELSTVLRVQGALEGPVEHRQEKGEREGPKDGDPPHPIPLPSLMNMQGCGLPPGETAAKIV